MTITSVLLLHLNEREEMIEEEIRSLETRSNLDSRKEFKKILVEIQRKEIERPEALYIEEFAALHEELHSKTLINSVMLALGRVTRLLLLKRGTARKGEAKHDDEAVYRGLGC
ncbi:hypothetical protein Tco_0369471 [Tanacetum coccineum]